MMQTNARARSRRIWGRLTSLGSTTHTGLGFVIVAAIGSAACGRFGFDGDSAGPAPDSNAPEPGPGGTCQLDVGCRGGACVDGACASPPPADRECAGAVRDALAPVVLFTDLTSGPAHGGERDLGVFVTLYGLRFGALDRVLVTYGGVEVARYVDAPGRDVTARGLETIVVQLGGALDNGPHDLVVTVGGRSSNPISFVQRLGGIYFVDPAATPSGDGSAASPWPDLYTARDRIRAGDTVYIRAGAITALDPVAQQLADPERRTNFYLEPMTAGSGRPDAPIAFVGYPGPSPRIGGEGPAASHHAIVIDKAITDLVLANLTFTNTDDYAIEASGAGRRLVGDTFTGIAPGFEEIVGYGASNVILYGNHAVDNTRVLIWLVGSHDFDLGWNHIENNGGEGFRIGGFGDGDLISNVVVHDNLLESHAGVGIVIGDYGSIVSACRIYNNILSNVQGSPILVLESVDRPMGDITIANNTFVKARTIDLEHVFGSAGRFHLVNSVIDAAAGTAEYFVPGMSFGSVRGDHNLYFGATAADPQFPPDDVARVVSSPGFVDFARGDLHLAPGSAGLDTGIDTGQCTDYLGVARPQGAGYDRGAFETPR
jgi:Right handed beta helix region